MNTEEDEVVEEANAFTHFLGLDDGNFKNSGSPKKGVEKDNK
jgi:hypothetical protein